MSTIWQPGDIVRDDNNDLWWRHWNNGGWGFLMRFPGRWTVRAEVKPGDMPILPLALISRDLKPFPGGAS